MESQNKNLEIKGKLSQCSCAELFAEISQAEFNGSLRISNKEQKVIAYFDSGDLVFTVSNLKKHRLFQILLQENAIPKETLLKVKGFANDLHLAKKLVEEEILTKNVVDSVFSIQIDLILRTVWSWESGNWSFSPLARIKDGIRFNIDLNQLLRNYSRNLKKEEVLNRFKSVGETFSHTPGNADFSALNLHPNEEGLCLKIGKDTLTVDELRVTGAFTNGELYKILYTLWLSGILKRTKWNSIFKDGDVAKIGDAKLVLKKSAASFEGKQKKSGIEKNASKKPEKVAEKEEELTLDAYLQRIKDSETYYELFNVEPEASNSTIKKIYFGYAKKFHPDLFYNKIENEKHKQIQKAFTEIARAYDTLKNKKTREVYDFKLREMLEAAKNTRIEKKKKLATADPEEAIDIEKNAFIAASQFERGHDLLTEGNSEAALLYFERAVNLDEGNAQYHAYFGKALSHNRETQHKAEAEIQIAIKLDNGSVTYRLMLVEIYAEIGLLARAKGELKRLLKIAPNNQDALSLLDRICNK